jgi:hypothetical protein
MIKMYEYQNEIVRINVVMSLNARAPFVYISHTYLWFVIFCLIFVHMFSPRLLAILQSILGRVMPWDMEADNSEKRKKERKEGNTIILMNVFRWLEGYNLRERPKEVVKEYEQWKMWNNDPIKGALCTNLRPASLSGSVFALINKGIPVLRWWEDLLPRPEYVMRVMCPRVSCFFTEFSKYVFWIAVK